MSFKELSLTARYDDLLRTQLPLFQFQETDWIKFLTEEIGCRNDIRNGSQELEKIKQELSQVKSEKRCLELNLVQVRKELEAEMIKRKRVQEEADNLLRQMQVIKEIVGSKNTSYNLLSEEDKQRLAFLNNSGFYGTTTFGEEMMLDDSLSLLSDSEYDKTGDNLLNASKRRRSKRKSAPLQREDTIKRYTKPPTAPPESEETDEYATLKKKKVADKILTTTSEDTDDSLKPPQTLVRRRSNRNKMRRSLSVGDPVDRDEKDDADSFFDIETGRRVMVGPDTPKSILKKQQALDSSPVSSPPESPTIKRWASASKLHRNHNLFQKNVVKPETCSPCGKKIKFGRQAFKCKECKMASHLECRDKMSPVCIPADSTPTKGSQGTMIADFAPHEPPFVPGIILQCVNEVEMRGLTTQGIYRETGSIKEIKDLKEKFLSGKHPKLENITDIHVICGCLKDFLRGLKEPLIPTAHWPSFVNAASVPDPTTRQECVRGAVSQLPYVNRDCLAFIIIHLQRVAERPETKMGVDNLSKVFGPTIVGYSVQTPEPSQMISETGPQQVVITSLMELDADYWTEILARHQSDGCSVNSDLPQTPESRDFGANSQMRSTAKVRQFFGESPNVRYPSLSSVSRKSFFPSPMLK